ncbi:TNF receptor-associated-like protein, mitochondria [Acrasis kona]|uniref:TNF receptor-associated-like protein, mitochondria n=1 Tax=Acrasis kona TaxID=1008807 RepID=A0AAW2ZBE6_9EUKA
MFLRTSLRNVRTSQRIGALLKNTPRISHVQSRLISNSQFLLQEKKTEDIVNEFEKDFKDVVQDKKPIDNSDLTRDDDVVIEEVESETEKLQSEGLISETENVIGQKETMEFQTETQQLLNIVATALYTDKEVFIRELISNASDALEKARQFSITDYDNLEDPEKPLQINVSVDEGKRVFIIQDSGIGMTREELMRNIGTIAHSGSKSFVNKLKESSTSNSQDVASNIIGQFGVGFYSAFMVADKVRVYTRSARKGSQGYCWESIGEGNYTISEAEGVARGTKIVIELKDTDKEFAIRDAVERIIKKYSNFVSHKIELNGSPVNTLDAVWLRSKDSVTPEEHSEFFKYLTGTSGHPTYTIQFSTDVPLSLRVLFYIPDSHSEDLGGSKMEPGVNVYSKKVLIKAKHREILPDWLRFVKGAVDSEDLPLNISREHLQNSPLIRRINSILVKKVIKFFQDMMAQDREKYVKWYDRNGKFFKEGISSDYTSKDELSKLLMFESSKVRAPERTSIQEYVDRMGSDEKTIYYINSPNRQYAENSPYMESFKKKGIEVLYCYSTLDEFTMLNLGYVSGKDVKSVESSDIDVSKDEGDVSVGSLTDAQVTELGTYIKKTLAGRVSAVTSSKRLVDTPAVIRNPENSTMRYIRRIQNANQDAPLDPQKLEINPKHPLIVNLYHATQSEQDSETAQLVAEQVFDNALIGAGLLDDPRSLLPRLNKLLKQVTTKFEKNQEAAVDENKN